MKNVIYFYLTDCYRSLDVQIRQYLSEYGGSNNSDFYGSMSYTDNKFRNNDGDELNSDEFKVFLGDTLKDLSSITKPNQDNPIEILVNFIVSNDCFKLSDLLNSQILPQFKLLKTKFSVNFNLLILDLDNKYPAKDRNKIIRDIHSKCSNSIRDIILIQNQNINGAILALNHNFVLSNFLAEYACTCMSGFEQIFDNPAFRVPNNNKESVICLGLSSILLDRTYFCDYLVPHVYMYRLEREGFKSYNGEEDIPFKLSIGDIAKNVDEFFNIFFNEHCLDNSLDSLYNKYQNGKDKNIAIFAKKEYALKFKEYLEDHLKDMKDSESYAFLVRMLLKDDDMFNSFLRNDRYLTFFDILDPYLSYIALWNKGNPAYNKPFVSAEVIKDDKKKINSYAGYIRDKEKELETLKKTIKHTVDADKVLLNKYQGYKIPEGEFKEKYSPKNYTKEKAVDLSENFTSVKDQGKVGSCTAFAVTSVIEYLINSDNGGNPNLSERFVYYNSREDKTIEGSSIYDSINSVMKKGICVEELCPYIEDECNDKPDDDAFDNAEERKIVEARNIDLSESFTKNVELIKTAIAEGFPVIIAAYLSDSFYQNNSVKDVPTTVNMESRHAMVVCGFEESKQLFKVRNSWGKAFGDDGYCYMPYAYVADYNLVNSAFIITEATCGRVASTVKKGFVFNYTDDSIKAIIIRGQISYYKKSLEDYNEIYEEHYEYFEGFRHFLMSPEFDIDFAKNKIRQQLVEDFQQSEEARLQENPGCLFGKIGSFIGKKLSLKNKQRASFYSDNDTCKDIVKLDIAYAIFKELYELKYSYGNDQVDINELYARYKWTVNNLRGWYKEMYLSLKKLSNNLSAPFISVMNNDCLNDYFKKNRDRLCDNVELQGLWHEDENIIYKRKKELIQNFKKELIKDLNDFEMTEYIYGNDNYDFVPEDRKTRDMYKNHLEIFANVFANVINANFYTNDYYFATKKIQDKAIANQKDICICEIESCLKITKLTTALVNIDNIK